MRMCACPTHEIDKHWRELGSEYQQTEEVSVMMVEDTVSRMEMPVRDSSNEHNNIIFVCRHYISDLHVCILVI